MHMRYINNLKNLTARVAAQLFALSNGTDPVRSCCVIIRALNHWAIFSVPHHSSQTLDASFKRVETR
jgi:hypothetical protein